MNVLMLFALLVTLSIAGPPDLQAQQSAQVEPSKPAQRLKRLILKDGSFESINAYEIKGNLVRYFSSERHEWEEVPAELVDWPATRKFAEEATVETHSRHTAAVEAENRERAEEEAKSPSVATGLRLPDTGGILLLDRFEGKPELNLLRQNGANVNKNTGRNILRGVINPVAGSKQTIELSGLAASVQSHVADPSIYVNLDFFSDASVSYAPETAKDHFRIVRCETKNGKRIVGALNIAIYGKVNQNASYLPTNVQPVLGRWVKVSPEKPLPPGEYALVELLGKDGLNTLVWDFGVNSSAPANASAQRPNATAEGQLPALQKREKRADP